MRKTVVSGVLGLCSLLAANIASAYSVEVNPGVVTVAEGGNFFVTIDVVDSPDNLGGGVILSWDSSIIQLVTSATDIDLEIDSNFDFGFASSAPGTATLSYSNFLTALNGNFTIATLEFTGVLAGNTNISMAARDGDLFTDFNGIPLATQPDLIGASVEVTAVTAVPLPGAVWLFGAGLVGVIGVARRRSVSAA